MRPLSPTARRQLDELTDHYERLDRAQAIRNLMAALVAISDRIEANSELGLQAPTPYPQIESLNLGFRWLRQGSYWFAFTPAPELTIAGVSTRRQTYQTDLNDPLVVV